LAKCRHALSEIIKHNGPIPIPEFCVWLHPKRRPTICQPGC
jgi:hypothetical protein